MHLDKIATGRLTDFRSGKQCGRTARWRAVRSCLCVGILLHTAVASAQADIKIERVAQWGGSTPAVAVAGDRAYVGVGPRLAVLDISDPARPVEIGRSAGVMRRAVEEIAVSGDYAYVSAGSLHILDVSDPTKPALIGEYASPVVGDTMGALAVKGDYAYVILSASEQLQVVDVSDPRSPKRVHTMQFNFWAVGERVMVSGEHLFVRTTAGVTILEISNPAMPREVGTIFEFDPIDVAVSGNYVYSWNGNWRGGVWWLDIYDVSNPEVPVLVGSYRRLEPPPLFLTGHLEVRDGLAYMVFRGPGKLRILDVSDPTNPTPLGEFGRTPELQLMARVALSEKHIYVPSWPGGLDILDVGDPTAPAPLDRFELAGPVTSLGLADGFVAVGGGMPNLRVLDVSDLSDPRQVAEVRLEASDGKFTIDGSIVYFRLGRALHLISIADPTAPEFLASVEMPDIVAGVTIAGQYAFVMVTRRGLMILDVSDPSAPVQVGSYRENESFKRVSISGSVAFLFDGSTRRIRVLDISDVTFPVPIGDFSPPGFTAAMAIRDNLAYLASESVGLVILNISNPVAPIQVGVLDTPDIALDVQLAGRYAYIADRLGGVVIVDISDPTRPALIGRHDTFLSAGCVSVSGSYVFVADSWGGLVILRTTVPGDMNCDGRFNGADIDAFFLALGDPPAYTARFPNCNILNGDMNADGALNGADLDPFFACLGGGVCP